MQGQKGEERRVQVQEPGQVQVPVSEPVQVQEQGLPLSALPSALPVRVFAAS